MSTDISLLQRRKPHMQESYLKKMARRGRNQSCSKTAVGTPIMPPIRQSSHFPKSSQELYTLVKDSPFPSQRFGVTHQSTPYKAMKQYVDKNYDPFISETFDGLNNQALDTFDCQVQIRDQNLVASVNSSLPSIDMNNTEDHKRFLMNTIASKVSDKESTKTKKSILFTGSVQQNPQEMKETRKKFFQNIAQNKVVVTPSNETMKMALDLGMPYFNIIQNPITDDRKNKKIKKKENGLQNLRKGGSIDFFSSMHKEAIQMVGKRQKVNKSNSVSIEKFRSNAGSEAEAQAFQMNKNAKQLEESKQDQNYTIKQIQKRLSKIDIPQQNRRQSKRKSTNKYQSQQPKKNNALNGLILEILEEDETEDESETGSEFDIVDGKSTNSSCQGDHFIKSDPEAVKHDDDYYFKLQRESQRITVNGIGEQVNNLGQIDGLMALRQGEDIKRSLEGFVQSQFSSGNKDFKQLVLGRMRARYGHQLTNDMSKKANEEQILQKVLDTTAHYHKKTQKGDLKKVNYRYQAFQEKYQKAFKKERKQTEIQREIDWLKEQEQYEDSDN